RKQSIHSWRLRVCMALRIEHSDPISGMLVGSMGFQFFSNPGGSALFEVRSQCGNLVGQNGVVFGERVPNNDPVKHAESAGEHRAAASVKSRISWAAMERGSTRFKDITHAADGMDELSLERIVHLCPQTAHHDIDNV